MKMTELEPQGIWKNFSLLNAIPRPSKKEEKVIAFIRSFGEALGLPTSVDEVGNVLIKKPAMSGMEDRQHIVLQSHLDMVCQKNNDTEFDFDKDGIQTYIDGDWVKAKGTTLGADNGIGVATIMTILESSDIPHPAIEALFTIDEETGMTGAAGLKPGVLTGKILLNLDTEEDDEIDIGCAGGIDITATGTFDTKDIEEKGVSITIKGLQGGHSGVDIHRGRANANVLLSRFLYKGLNHNIRLVELDGGGLRNAIPREAKATFVVDDNKAFFRSASSLKNKLFNEFGTIEKQISIEITEPDVSGKAVAAEQSAKIIKGLVAAHNGVYRMSPTVEGLVEASNNIARISLQDGHISVLCLTRSSVESTKMEVAYQLQSAFELAGMSVELSGSYPGWEPNPDAKIIAIMENIYKDQFGEDPKVVACHAGLECGIIGGNYPGMEMVSFGPTIIGAHSPEERVSITSVQKFWSYLQAILKEIPKGH